MLFCVKKKWFLITLFLIAYAASYCALRIEKLLIHRVTFITDRSGEKSYYHYVARGDFGNPMLTGTAIWRLADIAYYVYFPIRFAEKLFWKIYPREYNFG